MSPSLDVSELLSELGASGQPWGGLARWLCSCPRVLVPRRGVDKGDHPPGWPGH